MTDYFALLGEARRAWLDPEKLKEKYFALSRAAAADAELNEAFRVLGDPKLRLHHLLTLEGADLVAGRPVPATVAELFWNTGMLLREVDKWLLGSAGATSTLSRALLNSDRTRLKEKLKTLQEQLNARYETELAQLPQIDAASDLAWPDKLTKLVPLYDSISYLTRLREQATEKWFRLQL